MAVDIYMYFINISADTEIMYRNNQEQWNLPKVEPNKGENVNTFINYNKINGSQN